MTGDGQSTKNHDDPTRSAASRRLLTVTHTQSVTFDQAVTPRPQHRDTAASIQCEANVWVRPGYWHKFQCKRKATTEVDRLPLCAQHAKLAEQKGIRYVQ